MGETDLQGEYNISDLLFWKCLKCIGSHSFKYVSSPGLSVFYCALVFVGF